MRVFSHWPHQLWDHNDVPLWGVRVCVLCGFTLQGPRVSGSYWQPQSEDDMEEGDGAGLMADSSCFWSALHSVHIRHLLPDESGVELERRVESWEAVCFFFFPSFWWRHPFDRVTVPPPLFPSVACHSFPVRLFTCLTCLQVAVCAIQILWQTLPQ